MLTIHEQKEIIIDEIARKYNNAIDLAKFSRQLKLFNSATKYYYLASGYKKALEIIRNTIN